MRYLTTGSNLCPDEKGTESVDYFRLTDAEIRVATYAAMKSGLKGSEAYVEDTLSIV